MMKSKTRGGPKTLAIDIGGTGLKVMVLDKRGKPLTERMRIKTPVGATPQRMIATLVEMAAPLPKVDRVSVGFPGVVRAGRVLTAPNLGNAGWKGFDLAGALSKALRAPVRVLNDADLQGLAVIAGEGVEMVITLGTGFGTGLYMDGRPAPHLELAHHPFRRGETYEEQLGATALESVGRKRWMRRVLRAIETLRALVTFDRLYIGGGNARLLDIKLPKGVEIVSNTAGLLGGISLWREGI
jgi:polyphosphate glucokinase